MLLVIDVGNSQTVLGLFEGQELVRHWRFATEVHRTGDELAALVDSLLRLDGVDRGAVDGLALASVVPRLNAEYARLGRAYLGVEPLVVGPGVKTGMPIHTNNPREVGADLIVDAVAAYEAYGGPCMVVDFGTATTFRAVSGRGEYLGHAIAPGIVVSMEALASRAAKLPLMELADPGSVIGKKTVHSMQAGAVYGFAGPGGRHRPPHAPRAGRGGRVGGHRGSLVAHLRPRRDAGPAGRLPDAPRPGDHPPAQPVGPRGATSS